MPDPLGPNLRVPVQCPNCGHAFEKTIREIQSRSTSACPRCGDTLSHQKGSASLKEIGKGLNDLKRKLKRFGK